MADQHFSGYSLECELLTRYIHVYTYIHIYTSNKDVYFFCGKIHITKFVI